MRNARIILVLFVLVVSNMTSVVAFPVHIGEQPMSGPLMTHDTIIWEGLHYCQNLYRESPISSVDSDNIFQELVQWYTIQPTIVYVSYNEPSMTIKFIDGSYVVIFDVISTLRGSLFLNEPYDTFPASFIVSSSPQTNQGKTAVLLNPAEYVYGHRHCQQIATMLIRKGYNLVYRENQDVTLSYLRQNLTADVLYMNTHAGYWDIDGDNASDQVIIASGEEWTNETPQKYPFEYEHYYIVEGIVGERSFIAFTPGFIHYYYSEQLFPDSLIYMATCFASTDDSMAHAFLTNGASTYVGWSQNTVFYTNSITSVKAFRLLTLGCTVKLTCSIIRSGGFLNWLLQTKLIYYGDGSHKIP